MLITASMLMRFFWPVITDSETFERGAHVVFCIALGLETIHAIAHSFKLTFPTTPYPATLHNGIT